MSGGLRHRQLSEWRERLERSAMQGLGVGTLVAELRTDDTPRVNFHVRALAALQRAFIYCTATARRVQPRQAAFRRVQPRQAA